MKLTDGIYLVGSGSWGFDTTDALDCHVYLIDGGTELALVDAGAGRSAAAIVENIISDGLAVDRLRYVLLTHGHADHSGGVSALQETIDVDAMASHEIADAVRNADEQALGLEQAREARLYPADFTIRSCRVGRELREGDTVKVGRRELGVIETPGHSQGSLSFVLRTGGQTMLFCGDSLFYGGKLALQAVPDCDLQASLRTIEKLGHLTVDGFFPGHLSISVRRGQRHIDAALQAVSALGIPANIL